MSLICYSDGKLYADRSGVVYKSADIDDLRVGNPVELSKLFISKDKTIAVVCTGPRIDEHSEGFKNQIKYLKEVLKPLVGHSTFVSLRCKSDPSLENCILYVMTTHGAYECEEIAKDPGYRSLTPLNGEFRHFHGSGRNIAELLSNVKPDLPMEEIFRRTAIECQAMWETDIDVVEMSSLKPIQKPVAPKKPAEETITDKDFITSA